jgi:hypothetical protein
VIAAVGVVLWTRVVLLAGLAATIRVVVGVVAAIVRLLEPDAAVVAVIVAVAVAVVVVVVVAEDGAVKLLRRLAVLAKLHVRVDEELAGLIKRHATN